MTARKAQGPVSLTRGPKRLSLVIGLAASLAACQSSPVAQPTPGASVTQSQSLAPSAYKAGNQEPGTFAASIVSDGHSDRLRISLSPRLQQTFKTQAADLNQIKFLKLTVTGPGIATPIQTAGFIAVTGTPSSVTIPDLTDIPSGPNRLIKAQFYDVNQLPIANAVAMGYYSSTAAGTIPIDLRRRFVPTGRVLETLQQMAHALASTLDAAALQLELDKVLYGGAGVPGAYIVDPVLVDTNLIVTRLISAQGLVSGLTPALNDPSYVKATSTLTLPVTGLLGTDTLTVRVDDPTSTAVTAGNGTITITNIAPGKWPVYVTLNSTANFKYPGTTLGGTSLPPSGTDPSNPAQVLIPNLDVTPGQVIPPVNYDLVPAAPQIQTDAGIWTRTGRQLTITGSGFYPDVPTANKVRFVQGATSVEANVASATDTALVIDVPDVPLAGAYTVTAAAGAGTPTNLGTVRVNVLAVSPTGDSVYDSNGSNGLGWDKTLSLEAALAEVGPKHEIWLATGVYKPVGAMPASSFVITQNTSLLGGFDGELTPALRQAGNITELSGDHGAPVDDISETNATDPSRSDNSEHVIQSEAAGVELKLDNLTIRDGNTQTASENGAGLLFNGGSLKLNQVKFLSNICGDGRGGGLYVEAASAPISLTDVRFEQNRAQYPGGGLAIKDSPQTVVLKNVTFHQNGGQDIGGGMHLENATASLEDVIFSENTTGGGLAIDSASAPIGLKNVTFTSNTSSSTGGGMFIQNSSHQISLEDVTFQSNTSSYAGGGLYILNAPATLSDVNFLNNTSGFGFGDAGGGGMAVVNNSHPLSLVDVLFSANTSAFSGAGLALDTVSGTTTLNRVQFTGNTADTKGGGLSLRNVTEPLSLTNSSFTQNTATNYNGGGLRIENASANLSQVDFVSNHAPNAIEGKGGGLSIYNENSELVTLTDVNIKQNDADAAGGGLHNYIRSTAQTQIVSSVLEQNTTPKSGGGIFSQVDSSSSKLELSKTTVKQNVARDGGGLYINGGIHHLSETIFDSNQATGNAFSVGGGIAAYQSTLTLVNSLLLNNYAQRRGGGISFYDYRDDLPQLRHVTFYLNQAGVEGAEIRAEAGATPQITSCLIWNPASSAVNILDPSGLSLSTITHSVVSNFSSISNINNIDNIPESFSIDAGSVESDIFTSGSQRLVAGSPAINIGDPNGAPPTDLDNLPRQDGLPDAGAYEF